VHALEERWMLLDDPTVEQAMKDAEALAKKMKKWLETPATERTALDVEKYLKAEEAQEV
jgi:hypothetical protein